MTTANPSEAGRVLRPRAAPEVPVGAAGETPAEPGDPFSGIEPALKQSLAVFDAELRSDLPFVNDLIACVRRYRGKLLRPRLVLLAAEACGGIRPAHLTLAAVVEMVHLATLVHDDVLDEADVRRDGPTVGALAGNEAAVMLGDCLISHAYHLCSRVETVAVSRRIAAVTNTVCEGELMQIHHRGDLNLTEAQYFEIINRKTAALTAACTELAAVLCQADDSTVSALAAYGRELGVAFQIVDDVLDLTGSQDEVGKSVGRDARLGELTLPAIRFLSRHPQRREELAAAMRGPAKGSDGPGRSDRLSLLLEATDAVSYALGAAKARADAAVEQLAVLPPSAAREALAAAAKAVLSRRR